MPSVLEIVQTYAYGSAISGNAQTGVSYTLIEDTPTGTSRTRIADPATVDASVPRKMIIRSERQHTEVAVNPSPLTAANLAAREAARPKGLRR